MDGEHSSRELLPDLLELVHRRGGSFSDKLAIGESPFKMGTGVLCKVAVEKGEVITTLPLSLGITPERTRADEAIGAVLRDSLLNDIVCIHVFLAYHKKLGKDSPWADYINTLPEQPAVPLLFSEEHISFLNPSTAFDKLGWAIEELSLEYHSLQELGMFTGALAPVDFACYRWATGICLSRLFFVAGTPVLLPVVDAFNHHPTKGSEVKSDGRHYVLHAREDQGVGEEVFVTYGPGGPQAYFFHYGFVDPPSVVMQRRTPNDTTSPPWWLNYMLTPESDFCHTIAESDEPMHILMQDVVPDTDDAWDIEVPPEFSSSDLKLDVAGTLHLFKTLVAVGGPDIDVTRFTLSFGRDAEKGTVLLEPASLCALRLLTVVQDELQSWYYAMEGKSVGPRSEIACVALLTAALRARIERMAETFVKLVRLLGVVPDEKGAWKFSGPLPTEYDRLCQIGAVLCHETMLTQRLMEEAAGVPDKYLHVTTEKRRSTSKWK